MFNEINNLILFFENPSKEYNVRQYSRLMKITPATASKLLKKLYKNGYLKYRKERLYDLYKSNLENEIYRDLKIYYNLRIIKESNLLNELNQFYLKPTIIFFGSGSKGLDIENSDFDLVIISEKNKDFLNKKKYGKILKRELQLFIIKDIKELKNSHLINNVLNGIIIQGEVKWI